MAKQSHAAWPYSVQSLEMTFCVTAITVATRDGVYMSVCVEGRVCNDIRSSSDTPSLGHVVCRDSVEVKRIGAPNGGLGTEKHSGIEVL